MLYEFTHSQIHSSRAFHERSTHPIKTVKEAIDRVSELAKVIQRQKDFASHIPRVGKTSILDASILPRAVHRNAPGRVKYTESLSDREFEKLLEENTKDQVSPKDKPCPKRGRREPAGGSRSDEDRKVETVSADKYSDTKASRQCRAKKNRRSAVKKEFRTADVQVKTEEPDEKMPPLFAEDNDGEDDFPPTVAASCSARNFEREDRSATGSAWDRGGYYRTAAEATRVRLARKPPHSPASSYSSNALPTGYLGDQVPATVRSHSSSPERTTLWSSPSSATNRPAQVYVPSPKDCASQRGFSPDNDRRLSTPHTGNDEIDPLGMHLGTPYTEDYRHDETQFDFNWQTKTRAREDYRRNGTENGFPVEYPPRGEVYRRDEVSHHIPSPLSMQTPHREDYRRNGVAFSPYMSAQPPPASGRLYQTARRPSSNSCMRHISDYRSPSTSPATDDYLSAPYDSPSSAMPLRSYQQQSAFTSDEPLFRHNPQVLYGHDEADLRQSYQPYGFKRSRLNGFDELSDLRSMIQDGLGQIRRDIAIGTAKSHVNSEYYQAEMVARQGLVTSMVANGNKRFRDLESLEHLYPGGHH